MNCVTTVWQQTGKRTAHINRNNHINHNNHIKCFMTAKTYSLPQNFFLYVLDWILNFSLLFKAIFLKYLIFHKHQKSNSYLGRRRNGKREVLWLKISIRRFDSISSLKKEMKKIRFQFETSFAHTTSLFRRVVLSLNILETLSLRQLAYMSKIYWQEW